jgi:hypothetical protein
MVERLLDPFSLVRRSIRRSSQSVGAVIYIFQCDGFYLLVRILMCNQAEVVGYRENFVLRCRHLLEMISDDHADAMNVILPSTSLLV